MLRQKACVDFSIGGFSILIGADLAERFFHAFGGFRIRIPRSKDASIFKRISGVVGFEAAQKISAEFGGESIYVMKCEKLRRRVRNREMRSLYDEMTMEGRQSSRTAVFLLSRQFELSDRTVERIVNGQLGRE